MLSLNPSGKGVCNNFIHLSSVSNRLMFLNLTEEFSSYEIFFHWLNYNITGRMTSALKMLVQKGIIIFGLSDSTIVLTKSFLQSSTSLSNILHPTIVCISSKNIYKIH